MLDQCSAELEHALKPLADLEAEMRRFAETRRRDVWAEPVPLRTYDEIGLAALAWAERLKALQG